MKTIECISTLAEIFARALKEWRESGNCIHLTPFRIVDKIKSCGDHIMKHVEQMRCKRPTADVATMLMSRKSVLSSPGQFSSDKERKVHIYRTLKLNEKCSLNSLSLILLNQETYFHSNCSITHSLLLRHDSQPERF